MTDLKVTNLLDLDHTLAAPLLSEYEFPWEALSGIKAFILRVGPTLPEEDFYSPSENVWIARTATVAPTAVITGPAIICEGAEVRHCAYIRGSVIVGRAAVVGNSCELKNCILFDNAQVPHFNYVGDSILGYLSHLGAGAVTSNLKSDKSLISVKFDGKSVQTGMKKFGAVLGDRVEVGCNSVLNPGTIVGRNTCIYPLSSVRGVIPSDSILKSPLNIVRKN